MKRCSACNQMKPDSDFMWNRKATGKLDSYCRPCRAEYKQQHYAANKVRYIENAATYRRQMAIERTDWLLEFFLANPCADCGETDAVVLEFDHLWDKKFSIASNFYTKPWDDILEEIAKCEVVCANCHRRRTALRGGFLRADVAQLVERDPSKVDVAGSRPVVRSKN